MPEYHTLRVILAALQLCLCIQISRYRLGSLLVFGLSMYLECIGNAIPAAVFNGDWWRTIWLPLAFIRLIAAIWASLDLFAFLRGRISTEERILLLAWSVGIGLLWCLAGWLWIPANQFQWFTTIRQYGMLCLAAGCSGAWVYVRWIRPVQLSSNPLQLNLWCIWLWLAFLMSTTGAGGLAWTVFTWKGGLSTWRAINDACLVGQCWIAGWWIFNLRRQYGAAPFLARFPRSIRGDGQHLLGTAGTLPAAPDLLRSTADAQPSSCGQRSS